MKHAVSLETAVSTLPEPGDYFSGLSVPFTTLPRSILLFAHARDCLDVPLPALHHRFVFLAPVRGEGGVIRDGRLCHIAPGQAMLIFPYQTHYYAQLSDSDLFWLFVTFEYDAEEELASLRDRYMLLTSEAAAQLQQMVVTYQHDDDPLREGVVALALANVLWRSMASASPPPQEQTEPLDRKAALMGQISRYVYQYVDQGLTPHSIAEHFALSESHLRAQFRQSVGTSLGRFIRHARICTACHLLHTTERQVTDIARCCGYDSVFSFSRAFHTVMQCSPLAFRRQRGSRQ